MISLKQVISQIKDFADAHEVVQKFGYEFKEQMQNLATVDEKYPYFFVTPIGAMALENVVEFELDVYCVDRTQKDRTNLGLIVSDTQLVLTDFTVWLEDGEHAIEVERIYPMTPINNDLLDYVSGWVVRVKVQVERVALCEVPMTGIDTDETECLPVLIYENGILVATVPSGGTYEYFHGDAHYIITDTDGNVLYSGDIAENDTLTQAISDSVATLQNSALTVLSTTNILAEGTATITAPDATATIKNTAGTTIATEAIPSGATEIVTITDSALTINSTSIGSVVAEGSANIVVNLDGAPSGSWDGNSWEVTSAQVLTWELNYNGTDDVIFIPATASNVGTLASGSGTNVGTITVSTDGVTYGALSFPFTPVALTTYYFKRSTATVTGAYAMVGTYV